MVDNCLPVAELLAFLLLASTPGVSGLALESELELFAVALGAFRAILLRLAGRLAIEDSSLIGLSTMSIASGLAFWLLSELESGPELP